MMILRPEGIVTRTLVARLSPRRLFRRAPRTALETAHGR